MKYKIRINPLAITDVKEIKEYIAEDNPTAAANIGKMIYSSIEKLSEFPKMGVSLDSKIDVITGFRYIVCGNYLIFYKIEGEFISVYRVLNGLRDYMAIFFADEVHED